MPSRRLGEMLNIGPVTERMLAEVDIGCEADLRAVGAAEAWRRLKFRFPRQVSLVGLYALEGALRDCPWNGLPPGVKAELKEVAQAYRARMKMPGG